MSEDITTVGRSLRTPWPDSVVVLETQAVVLRYHRQARIVHHELRRFVHGPEFRNLLERGLELLQENKATKWLSDDRGNGPLKPADAEWSQQEWAPRAAAAGWKYWAVVLPKKVLGQMNMKRWIELSAEVGRVAQGFSDSVEAMRWLESQG